MRPKEAFGRFGCRPLDLHPAWRRVHYGARALGMDMLAHCAEPGERKLPVEADWMSSVCLTLGIDGKDRRNQKVNLQSLLDAGLITIGDGWVRVELEPCSDRVATVSPVGRQSVAASSPLGCVRVANNTQVAEIRPSDSLERREEIRKEERAETRAGARVADRPEDIGFRFVASLLGRSTFDVAPLGAYPRQYASIGARPEAERAAVKLAVEADEWCKLNPQDVDAPHLERRWQKYLAGPTKPVLKPLAATPREQLEKARERLQDAAKTLRIIEGLPWFDKEKPTYPERLAKATADVSRLRGELSKLENGFTRPAVAS